MSGRFYPCPQKSTRTALRILICQLLKACNITSTPFHCVLKWNSYLPSIKENAYKRSFFHWTPTVVACFCTKQTRNLAGAISPWFQYNLLNIWYCVTVTPINASDGIPPREISWDAGNPRDAKALCAMHIFTKLKNSDSNTRRLPDACPHAAYIFKISFLSPSPQSASAEQCIRYAGSVLAKVVAYRWTRNCGGVGVLCDVSAH